MYVYIYINIQALLVLVNAVPTKTCKDAEAYYTHFQNNMMLSFSIATRSFYLTVTLEVALFNL